MTKTAFSKKNRYSAYTLLELLVVMSIFMIFGTMAVASFGGLQNTVKMNEYMLNMEQNVRLIQRSAMLLERGVDERWLYGLGVDFSQTGSEDTLGVYKVFKWCSPFNSYGDIKTTSDFPNYDPGDGDIAIGNGGLPSSLYLNTSCTVDEFFDPEFNNEIIALTGMDISYSPPKSTIAFGTAVRYILFESVSGKAFFYNSSGELLNYEADGTPIEDAVNFQITLTPLSSGNPRRITVDNLSGRISPEVL